MLDVCLVAMPFMRLDFPSSSISTLIAAAKREGLCARAVYPCFWFAELFELGAYETFCMDFNLSVLCEWMFSGSAFPDFKPDHDNLFKLFENRYQAEQLWRLRRTATDFIRTAAKRIVDLGPKMVGCTVRVQQQCASLALLREIKALAPQMITMAGGPCCDGVMARATLQAFPWVDYVFSGEADATFPQLCRYLLDHDAIEDPGKLPAGVGVGRFSGDFEPAVEIIGDLDDLPIPDYDDYFIELVNSRYHELIAPALPMETSRGCWWGEKQGCRFCAEVFNPKVVYRSKSAERAYTEVKALHARYGINRIRFTDNILNMDYFDTFLPMLARDTAVSFSLFYDTKSNLNDHHLKLLAEAGVRWIQPGIESLHDNLLRLMNKGVTTLGNIALLKFARENGIRVMWNLLMGIPGEDDRWHAETAELLPCLFHLQPPLVCCPVDYNRFSHYHQHPQKYGLKLRPSPLYQYLFPVKDADMDDFAFYFEAVGQNKDQAGAGLGRQKLKETVESWKRCFKPEGDGMASPQLILEEQDHHSVITDTRPNARTSPIILEDAAHEIMRLCRHPIGYARLKEKIAAAGLVIEGGLMGETLSYLTERQLLLAIDGRFLSLATHGSQKPLPKLEDLGDAYYDILYARVKPMQEGDRTE